MERGYGKLWDRTLNLVSYFHAIKIVTKGRQDSLDRRVKSFRGIYEGRKQTNKQKNPTDLMKALEALTGSSDLTKGNY